MGTVLKTQHMTLLQGTGVRGSEGRGGKGEEVEVGCM